MTRWAAFGGLTLAVLVLLLVLARASQSAVTGAGVDAGSSSATGDARWLDGLRDGAGHLEVTRVPDPLAPADPSVSPERSSPPDPPGPHNAPASGHAEGATQSEPGLATDVLLANVALSHGLFAALLVGGAWLTGVPPRALGVTADPLASGPLGVAVGLAVGLVVAVVNAAAAALADRVGADPSEELRALLAPDSLRGWVVLLVLVLPVIAVFEELLFRGALVGAFAVGFGISPWLLAVLSSVAFAAGHGAQGGVGVVVTGLLGFALAATFVLTGSLLVVIVAHYVVNAVEFAVVEGLGWRPFD